MTHLHKVCVEQAKVGAERILAKIRFALRMISWVRQPHISDSFCLISLIIFGVHFNLNMRLKGKIKARVCTFECTLMNVCESVSA